MMDTDIVEMIGDQIDAAITECTNAILQLKMPEAATTDGIEKALKAHAAAIVKAVKTEPDTAIPALLERIVALLEADKDEDEEEKEAEPPIEFKITRDKNGYMTSVVAQPYREPEPQSSGVTYN